MSCKKNENQLNPTFGNVVFLHIVLSRYEETFPIGWAEDVEVNLISRVGVRIPLEKVTINFDSIDVEVGVDNVPSVGEYGVEARGTFGGYEWRSYAPCCLNYTYQTVNGGTDVTVTGDVYDVSMEVQMNAPDATDLAALNAHNLDPESHPYLLGLIDDVNASLLNYYTKSETYSQEEVNGLIQSISQFSYRIVDRLPTASASTMNKIYLVKSGTGSNVACTEYITIEENGRYRWETIGDTAIALENYSTTAQMNTAINNALTNYYTKLETNLRLAGKVDATDIAGYITGSTIRVRGSNGVVIEGNNGVNGTNYSAVNATKTGVSIVGQSLKWNNAELATKAYVQTYSQEKLVSGENIKTINNQSLLGPGNIDIQGGGGDSSLVHWTFTQEGTFESPTWDTDGHKYSDITALGNEGKTLLVTLMDLDGFNSIYEYNALGILTPLDDAYNLSAYSVSEGTNDSIVLTSVYIEHSLKDTIGTSLEPFERSVKLYGDDTISGSIANVAKVEVDDTGVAITTTNGRTATYNGNEIYAKPSAGIPATDLASAVQTSLGKADTALQTQVQADWNQTTTTAKDYIKNKPTIPDTTNFVQKSQTSGLLKNDGTVDTNTYLTSHQDISGKANKVVVVDASTLPSTLDPNKVYQMGTLTGSVTIPAFSAVASGDTEAKIWCFTFNTSTTAPTITWPAAITNWVGGSAPTINASKSYEVTVMDCIGAIMEA